MRTTEEMLTLIKKIAAEDDNIQAVLMSGSRANRDCPADPYQDFDIVYFVKDVTPYWDNMEWIREKFGMPSLLQKPESSQLMPPANDGNFVYLMIFPDGNRIDLSITASKYQDNGEPAIVLLDKTGYLPEIKINKAHWYIKRPSQKIFSDCCNEFHWCLNNVAKGIKREELSYTMEMLNHYVRDMLLMMLDWYAAVNHNFQISTGKNGKYYKKYLPEDLYLKFTKTYSDSEYEHIWEAAFTMLRLFGETARYVAEKLSFYYDESEEKGIETYMNQLRY